MTQPLPRIGSVPYLNARPLLEGLEFPITELVPAKLKEEFDRGRFEAAILSSIDVLSQPGAEAVDGVAIGSQGDVHSVILAYKGELESLQQVQLDPSSHTSNALLKILLGEFLGLHPEYLLPAPGEGDRNLPALLIGDPAIAFRRESCDPEIRYLDLGGEWYRQTGLPFVFALWGLRTDFSEKGELAATLRAAKQRGMANREALALRTPDPGFARRYLGEWIRYDLDDEEKRGLQLYHEHLRRMGLVSNSLGFVKFL